MSTTKLSPGARAAAGARDLATVDDDRSPENSPTINGKQGSALGRRIRDLKRECKIGLADLTVLAAQNDPYRVDTPAGRRDAEWFVEQFELALGTRSRLHLRGVHYAIVAQGDVLKPNGLPLVSSRWSWLEMTNALKAHKAYTGGEV